MLPAFPLDAKEQPILTGKATVGSVWWAECSMPKSITVSCPI